MIEFCSKKRMIAGIVILIVITVITLVFENRLPIGQDTKSSTNKLAENASKPCTENSRKEVILPCALCNDHEMKIHKFCQLTGYKESINCIPEKGEIKSIVQSCPRLSWDEEKKFWVFECASAVVGLFSYAVVYARQRRLDRLLIEKVHKQIAAGV